jgi:hypothetical protein
MFRWLLGLGCLLLLCAIVIGILLFTQMTAAQDATPPVTETAIPSLTSSVTETVTPTLTETSTATTTVTATTTYTSTPSATPSLVPTWTAVIQTVVVTQPPLIITIPVPMPVNPTALPIVPTIQPPISPPLPVAQPLTPTPGFGWSRIESQALIPMIGSWVSVRNQAASAGAFRESHSGEATLRFPFTGDGLRVIYHAHPLGGNLILKLDGSPLATVETYAEEAAFSVAGPYFFAPGYHVLDMQADNRSAGMPSIGIDAVEVFQGPPFPAVEVTAEPVADLAIPAVGEALAVSLVSQPPTPLPTSTPIPPVSVTVEIIVAYDLNRNGAVEPNEGVAQLSVRLVDSNSNRLLASGMTDAVGFVRLQAETHAAVTALIPYLGESFEVGSTRREQISRWTLLLDAGTQPGLIP